MVKEEITPTLYKRKITHTEYRHRDKKTKKGGWSRMLHHHISDNKVKLSYKAIDPKAAFRKANDKYMKISTDANVTPIWLGGTFLLMFIGSIYAAVVGNDRDTLGTWYYLLLTFFFLVFLFFLVYYFTMPKKEFIWNREDGLVTFPGFMWRPNITMPLEKVIFIRSAPSAQGMGSHLLQIARPDKSYSLYMASLDNTCYEDLSFYLWYMDKNRPLPPGSAFDLYRDRDYERRKAAGFPPPIFVSAFDTPEATTEQQAERKRIGGW